MKQGGALPLPVPGAYVCGLTQHHDDRGYFCELFNIDKSPHLPSHDHETWKQCSISKSKAHVLRGIHRAPYGKLVSCISGSVTDICVDLRPDSPTFGLWCFVLLSEANQRQVYIPPNCGHGFLSHSDCAVTYLQGGTYNPATDTAISYCDPQLAIQWSLPDGLIVSAKDQAAPTIKQLFPQCSPLPPLPICLIIGGSGQIGTALHATLSASYRVISTYVTHKNGAYQFPMDIEDCVDHPHHAEVLIHSIRPSIIIICGAMTWVDGCEQDKVRAMKINHQAPVLLAKMATGIGAKTVFLSTEYVFDGVAGPYHENSPANPVNVYGRAKLQAEEQLIEEIPHCLVIRTTVVYGKDLNGKNFLYQLARKLSAGETMNVPNDQVSSPTCNRCFAIVLSQLLGKGAQGIFHIAGSEVMDRATFARRAAIALHLDVSLIHADTTEKLYVDAKAQRPLAAGLLIDKVKQYLGKEWADSCFASIETCLAHCQPLYKAN